MIENVFFKNLVDGLVYDQTGRVPHYSPVWFSPIVHIHLLIAGGAWLQTPCHHSA